MSYSVYDSDFVADFSADYRTRLKYDPKRVERDLDCCCAERDPHALAGILSVINTFPEQLGTREVKRLTKEYLPALERMHSWPDAYHDWRSPAQARKAVTKVLVLLREGKRDLAFRKKETAPVKPFKTVYIGTPMRKPYTCSKCGKVGHNSRTCKKK